MQQGTTDHSKLEVDERDLAQLLEMAYQKQVARRRIAYVPNALTDGTIRQLAHFLTDSKDNRFMIVLDGGRTSMSSRIKK